MGPYYLNTVKARIKNLNAQPCRELTATEFLTIQTINDLEDGVANLEAQLADLVTKPRTDDKGQDG